MSGLARLTLILGGARSGKSRHGEALVLTSGLQPVYLATAQAQDDEMAARIAAHQAARRDQGWRLVEESLELAAALAREAAAGRAILVDCLTLWLTNLMVRERPVADEIAALAEALPTLPGNIVLVSNEVGQGVVPANAMARAYIDHAGRLHQTLAAQAETVIWMTAGLPQILKSPHQASQRAMP